MLPCLLLGILWKSVPTSHHVVSAPRLGGLGRQIFFQGSALHEGCSFLLPAALKPLHWNLLVWGRMARQGGGDFSTASGPGSTIPQIVSLQWGSMLMLGRDLA